MGNYRRLSGAQVLPYLAGIRKRGARWPRQAALEAEALSARTGVDLPTSFRIRRTLERLFERRGEIQTLRAMRQRLKWAEEAAVLAVLADLEAVGALERRERLNASGRKVVEWAVLDMARVSPLTGETIAALAKYLEDGLRMERGKGWIRSGSQTVLTELPPGCA